MQYKLDYLPQFEEDMDEISDYITLTLENPTASFKLSALVKRECEHLVDMPLMHHKYQSPVALEHEYRILPVNNYNVFYTVNEETGLISISRILSSVQDAESIITE
jgi:plasmid stabilization system protein ParE